MLDGLRALVREPLVHFALVGAVLFGVDRAGSRDEPDAGGGSGDLAPQRTPIVVDDAVRDALVEQWERTHPEPPTAEGLEALVQDWIDDEVLYREGLARGFARDDPQVRARVASQMAYVLRSRAELPEPSDAQLRTWFEKHADRFGEPDRVDFTQVFVDGLDDEARSRANELLRLLEGGADPNGLGDTFSGGRRFRGRKLADLTERFGAPFTEGLQTQPVGTWSLRPSPFGLHLVRVDRRTATQTPRFEAVRDAVLHDWQETARHESLRRATRQLRDAWEVVVEP